MEGRTGEAFTLYLGLDKGMVAQLKERSLDASDTEIQNNTSDRKRFGEGSYEEWYAKDRVPFALIHEKTGALAAVVWFGPKPLGRKSLKYLSAEELAREGKDDADNWHTLAYRSYPPFRGTGLMRVFIEHAMDVYRMHFPHAHFWTIVDAKNAGSVALSTKLGFTPLEEKSDETSVVMVKEN
jgi:hypothetical protein